MAGIPPTTLLTPALTASPHPVSTEQSRLAVRGWDISYTQSAQCCVAAVRRYLGVSIIGWHNWDAAWAVAGSQEGMSWLHLRHLDLCLSAN